MRENDSTLLQRTRCGSHGPHLLLKFDVHNMLYLSILCTMYPPIGLAYQGAVVSFFYTFISMSQKCIGLAGLPPTTFINGSCSNPVTVIRNTQAQCK